LSSASRPHPSLLEARQRAPANDTELVHTIRMALRNQLQAAGGFQHVAAIKLSEADSRALADVALGVKSAEAGSYVLKYASRISEPRESLMLHLRHAARYAPEAELDALVNIAHTKFGEDADAQFTLFKATQESLAQRGANFSDTLRVWTADLAEKLLAPADDAKTPWVSMPLDGASNSANPWTLEKRQSADGDRNSLFLSSLPAGETLTGILRSRPFVIPTKLSFFLAGHDGQPAGRWRRKTSFV